MMKKLILYLKNRIRGKNISITNNRSKRTNNKKSNRIKNKMKLLIIIDKNNNFILELCYNIISR